MTKHCACRLTATIHIQERQFMIKIETKTCRLCGVEPPPPAIPLLLTTPKTCLAGGGTQHVIHSVVEQSDSQRDNTHHALLRQRHQVRNKIAEQCGQSPRGSWHAAKIWKSRKEVTQNVESTEMRFQKNCGKYKIKLNSRKPTWDH